MFRFLFKFCMVLFFNIVLVSTSNATSNNLFLYFAGTGNGYVNISPINTSINTSTLQSITSNTAITLHPVASKYSMFTGWTGDCSGTSDCTFNMDSDKNVYAAFNSDTHSVCLDTTLTNCYSSFAETINATNLDSIIFAWDKEFDENITLNKNLNIKLLGGCNYNYSDCSNKTILNGKLIIQNGSLKVSNLSIRESKINSAPVANAGLNISAFTNSTVHLDGSGSVDADQDTISYNWALTSKPEGSRSALSSQQVVNPTIFLDMAGEYILSLIVYDGKLYSQESIVKIVATRQNIAPLADAGVLQNVFVGKLVSLDGGKSSDADGDPLIFNWTVVSTPIGSNVLLNNSTISNPTFIPDLPGTYIVKLIVNDGRVDSTDSLVNIITTYPTVKQLYDYISTSFIKSMFETDNQYTQRIQATWNQNIFYNFDLDNNMTYFSYNANTSKLTLSFYISCYNGSRCFSDNTVNINLLSTSSDSYFKRTYTYFSSLFPDNLNALYPINNLIFDINSTLAQQIQNDYFIKLKFNFHNVSDYTTILSQLISSNQYTLSNTTRTWSYFYSYQGLIGKVTEASLVQRSTGITLATIPVP